MFDGLDLSKRTSGSSRGFTWDFARRVQDATSMKLFIKGIVTREDAELCVGHGLDGLIVSNHGGRTEASGRDVHRQDFQQPHSALGLSPGPV